MRSEPLVLVEGTLERHASGGGAINLLVQRILPLDAPDLLAERPRATVKDFSPLDELERRRILAEQPLAAVAAGGAGGSGGGGAATAVTPASTPSHTGALAAAASSAAADGPVDGRRGGPAGGIGLSGSPGLGPAAGAGAAGRGSGVAGRGSGAAGRGSGSPGPPARRPAPSGAVPALPATAGGPLPVNGRDHMPADPEPTEHETGDPGGADDFRAVAPPVMSFAQGRRR